MVTPGTMDKEQFSKIAELTNCHISRPGCLKTFNTTNTDTYVGRLDHGNIVGTITNSQKQRFEVTLDKLNDESLLKGRDTTVVGYD